MSMPLSGMSRARGPRGPLKPARTGATLQDHWGAAFEFLLLVVLAVYLGIVEVATLRKDRRHAIGVMFIIAAVVTPTPDPVNQTLFAIPLVILYEAAILVAARLKRRRSDEPGEV